MTEGPPSENVTEGAPSDNTTLVAVLARHAEAGFDANVVINEDGKLRCPGCRTESDPSDVELDSMRRMEGASDPDDMLAVLAVTCPSCGEKGVAVLHYGPTATPGDVAVLRAIEVDERSGTNPPPAP